MIYYKISEYDLYQFITYSYEIKAIQAMGYDEQGSSYLGNTLPGVPDPQKIEEYINTNFKKL